MTDSDDRAARGLIDWLVMPGAPAEGAAGEAAPGEPAPGEPAPAWRPGWGRRVGAFVFWGLAQTLAVLPASLRFDPAHYRPLLPPLVGLAYTLLLATGFVWRFALRRDAGAEYRRETFRLRAIPTGALQRLPTVALPLLLMVVTSLVLVPRFIPVPPQRDDPLQAYLKLPYALLTVLALVSLVAPLLEEFFFRGWIQRRLEARFAPSRAIVVTALLFAAAHGEMFGFPIRLVFGLVAGYVAWSTRSIWPGVLLHGLYNATLVVGGSSSPDIDETMLVRWAHTPSIFWPTLAVFAIAAALLVLALRRVEAAARVNSAVGSTTD